MKQRHMIKVNASLQPPSLTFLPYQISATSGVCTPSPPPDIFSSLSFGLSFSHDPSLFSPPTCWLPWMKSLAGEGPAAGSGDGLAIW
ncbi:hypothetical protein Bca4012_010739 [Brassica carinata]|uniref:Uncharacterized protein n=1 Tax=Brassica carinata TaxID=52824 RepID=A0A8X7V1Z3_BRACI|nr:hypothetical protein Bca52824_035649 [Brassica carinata]